MSKKDKIVALIEKSSNGIVTSKMITDLGIHRSYIQELVRDGYLLKCHRGVYIKKDMFEDELYLLHLKYRKGVFSNETALYIHGYTDRTPIKYNMSFMKGYNVRSLKNENVIVKHIDVKNFYLGIMMLESPNGNNILIYDLERTLCDILRGKNIDTEIVNPAMKRYASSKNKDLNKLFDYAKRLKVYPKILRYMEILL